MFEAQVGVDAIELKNKTQSRVCVSGLRVRFTTQFIRLRLTAAFPRGSPNTRYQEQSTCMVCALTASLNIAQSSMQHNALQLHHVYYLCSNAAPQKNSKPRSTCCYVYVYIYTYTNMYGVTKWAITFSTDGYVYERKLQVFRECKTAKLRRRRAGKANDRFTYVRKGFGA